MQFRSLALACFTAFAAPACSGTDSEPVVETGVVTAEATAPTRLYASEGALELSFETLGTFENRNGKRALVLRATANRYLQHVFSFVPDDAFGTSAIISERRFEVVLEEGHELNTVLSGLPLFITVNTFTGTPNQYTARIVVAPRFYDFRGASGIYVETEVNPVYVRNGDDVLVYRGHASAAASALTVTAPDGIPTVTPAGAGQFLLDWQYPALPHPNDGSYIGREDLEQVLFFNPWRNGDALLSAVDVFAGGGEVQAWTSTYPIS